TTRPKRVRTATVRPAVASRPGPPSSRLCPRKRRRPGAPEGRARRAAACCAAFLTGGERPKALFAAWRGERQAASGREHMIPLVDMHCHLLAGLDDGPQRDADALAMCRMAYEDGTRMAAATAHQNDRWPAVTPERIRQATENLARGLREARIGLT